MEYRIAITLTKYFNDERSFCYVYVDNKYELISDLEDYLRNLFKIEGQFCLIINNFYLPKEENIKVIKDGEIVSVIPLHNDWRLEKCNKKRNEDLQDENENLVQNSGTPKPSKKKKKNKNKDNTEAVADDVKSTIGPETEIEKISVDQLNSMIEVNNDDNKEAMDVSVTSEIHDCRKNTSPKSTFIELCDSKENASSRSSDNGDADDIDGFNSISLTKNHTEMQNTIQLMKNRAITLLDDNGSKMVTGVSVGRINKRKRIRKRKNKNYNIPIPSTDVSETTGKLQSTLTSVKKSLTHIRFPDLDQSPLIVQNGGYIKEQPEKPRMIHALETDIELSNKLRSTSLSVSHESLNDGAHCFAVSTHCEDAKQTHGEEGSLECVDLSSEVDGTFKLKIDAITSELESFPPIGSALPVCKDIILFKMLKMDANYTPTISDYILAHVIDVEASNSVVKLSIIDGHMNCSSPKGKFNIEEEEEEGGEVVGSVESGGGGQTTLHVEWGRVVEARLVFP